ncbi:hypothetical protein EK21DRAFT_114263 [Setomelanomma holmii]|uniref:Uncharacterized protein n=1 Tax=Setomelanomma holmii TaxID=210430 RepID=A0A9P4H5J3_9PLEO|nr:hypothetical protein EK21DRAFT_114263 [Setomelanomma holmii]
METPASKPQPGPSKLEDAVKDLVHHFESGLENKSCGSYHVYLHKLDPSMQSCSLGHSGSLSYRWFARKLLHQNSDLVRAVSCLREQDGGIIELWGEEHRLSQDLPLLGAFSREAWIDPTLEDDLKYVPETLTSWCNLNSFASQLYGKCIIELSDFALWQLRTALEPEGDFDETRVAVAANWITNVGLKL